MPRYAAFLRGVSPLNAKMPALARAFEAAGFTNVVTVLVSGNVVFDARSATPAALERRAESAMARGLGRSFLTVVRPVTALEALLESDPFARHRLPRESKRVVTFAKGAVQRPRKLPIQKDGAKILAIEGQEIFTAYVPSPKGAAFMVLIEKLFGDEVTTRTWDTVERVATR